MNKKRPRTPLGEMDPSDEPNRGACSRKVWSSKGFSPHIPEGFGSPQGLSVLLTPEELSSLNTLQSRILEAFAFGAPTQETLDSLCLLVEEMVPGSVTSLLLYDEEKEELHWGAGPHVPPALKSLFDPIQVASGLGSCPSAILARNEVFVEDTLKDERWKHFRMVAEEFGLLSCWSTPITDGDGRIFGTFAISMDRRGGPSLFQQQLLQTARYLAAVTLMRDYWDAERRAFAKALRNHKRVESLGRLTGGIAHDFNNLLTALLAYCDLLKEKAQEDGSLGPGSLEDLKEIEKVGLKGAEIARKLLMFRQDKPFEFQVFSPNRVIEELCLLLRRVLREDLELGFHLTKQAGFIRADEAVFGQSLLYLILNVRDQLPQGGRVWLETEVRGSQQQGKQKKKGENPNVKGTFYLRVCGTNSEGLSSLKVDFHEDWLDCVEKFAKRVDGRLGSSKSQEGMPCWELSMPLVSNSCQQPPEPSYPSSAGEIDGKGKTILVCEDEPSIRALLERILEERGFEVVLAPDAEWAEKLYQKDPGAIDLLLTDLVLPGKNGFELACSLRQANEDLPVILATGYSQELDQMNSQGNWNFPILRKPFHAEELRQVIGSLLCS